MSIIENPFHVSPQPMQYVPNSKKTRATHGRSLSKSKSLSSLYSKYAESQNKNKQAQPKVPGSNSAKASAKNVDKDYSSKYDKILNAANNEDFQDVDLKKSFNGGGAAATGNGEFDFDDFKKLHESLQQPNRSLKYRSSSSNLRLSTNSTASLSSLGSPSLSMPRKFHNGSIADSSTSSSNNFNGLASRNSSVTSLHNNASFVRGLGIKNSRIRRPSDNLCNLKSHSNSQSYDSKSDSVSSGLDSVNESEYNNGMSAAANQRIEEQITIPAALSRPQQQQQQPTSSSRTPKHYIKGQQQRQPRPFSDDSVISSASSNFDFDNVFNSRISSLTSVENVSQISSPDVSALYREKTPKMAETPEGMDFKHGNSENYKFENFPQSASTSRTVSQGHNDTHYYNNNKHKRTGSSYTDNTLSTIRSETNVNQINGNSTINNSTTTINSNHTILDNASDIESSFNSQISSPLGIKTSNNGSQADQSEALGDDNRVDVRTRQNTLFNAQNSNSVTSLNTVKRGNPHSPRKRLNRIASMPVMSNNNDQNVGSRSPYPTNRAATQRHYETSGMGSVSSVGSSTSGLGMVLSNINNEFAVSIDSHVNGSPMVSPNGDTIINPGQKYKLRRQLSKKNLQSFRKEISQINTKDEVIDTDTDIPDSIFFNIPYATGSTATLFNNNNTASKQRNSVIKKVFNESQTSIPISPLISNSGRDGEFASDLSRFYADANDSYVANELAKREENHSKLPNYIISQLESQSSVYSLSPRSSASFESKVSSSDSSGANNEVLSPTSVVSPLSITSSHAIDELRLMSPEKIEHLSSTRPMWLPPKSAAENKQHQQQITEVFESYSKREIHKKEKGFQKIKTMLVNNQKWFEITVKHKEIHKPVISAMKHLCWKSNVPGDLRFKVWNDVLHYYNRKNGFENALNEAEGETPTISDSEETLESLQAKLSSINTEYLEPEIDLIIASVYPNLHLFQTGEKLHEPLKTLLLCKKVSRSGLRYGDEVLLALFLLNFSSSESYQLLILVSNNVMNDTFTAKFDANLSTNYVVKKYLDNHYKDEVAQLSTRTLYKIFMKVDPELVIKVFDFLVLHNTYKVWYCFVLVVLKFYHFGFLDLEQLSKGAPRVNGKRTVGAGAATESGCSSIDRGMFVDVDDQDDFLEKFHYYFKKF